ncbi:MAG: peptide ABC transporter ATP-binding protein, partial [Caldibacillus debilis]
EIMNLLKRLNNEGKTIIVVTHDEEVSKFCDYVINIKDGEII